jgi:hypothetical protein
MKGTDTWSKLITESRYELRTGINLQVVIILELLSERP